MQKKTKVETVTGPPGLLQSRYSCTRSGRRTNSTGRLDLTSDVLPMTFLYKHRECSVLPENRVYLELVVGQSPLRHRNSREGCGGKTVLSGETLVSVVRYGSPVTSGSADRGGVSDCRPSWMKSVKMPQRPRQTEHNVFVFGEGFTRSVFSSPLGICYRYLYTDNTSEDSLM